MENWSEEFKKYLNQTSFSIKIGDRVSGRIVEILDDYTFIDIGFKKEALLPTLEIKKKDGSFLFNKGDKIEVLVIGRVPSENTFLLSFSKLREQKLWEDLKNAFEKSCPIEVTPVSVVKGGYIVEFEGTLKGFLPFSQSYFKERPEDPKKLLNQPCKVYVLKVENHNFIVSRRKVLEEEYKNRKKELIKKIKKGEIVDGEVKKLIKGGFLVDIEGIFTGYLPFNEIAWQRIEDPGSYLKIGDKIKAKVIFFDEIKERIKLSIKATLPDPWEKVAQKYKEGQRIRGKVTKIFPFGAFVELEPGIEGLIPASEVSWRKKIKIGDILEEGDIVEAVIIDIRPSEKKLALSLKKLEPSPWEKFIQTYKVGDIISGKIKSIIDYGIFVEIEEGIEGFVHISNISWDRIENLKEIYKEGQNVEAKILEIDAQKKRIALSFKHLRENPWEKVVYKYKEGDIVEGVIKKVLSNGFLISVESEISAFMPFKEINSDEKNFKNIKDLKEGDKIKGKIIILEPQKRRMVLSYSKYLKDLERKELEAYKLQAPKKHLLTLGEIILNQLKRPS